MLNSNKSHCHGFHDNGNKKKKKTITEKEMNLIYTVNVLMGGKGVKNLYILDENHIKLHEPEDKEKEFRSIWSNGFRISDKEHQNFDHNHETMVTDYLK